MLLRDPVVAHYLDKELLYHLQACESPALIIRVANYQRPRFVPIDKDSTVPSNGHCIILLYRRENLTDCLCYALALNLTFLWPEGHFILLLRQSLAMLFNECLFPA